MLKKFSENDDPSQQSDTFQDMQILFERKTLEELYVLVIMLMLSNRTMMRVTRK